MEHIQNKYLFLTIQWNSFADINKFIEVWSKGYSYLNMDLYSPIILKSKIEIEDLKNLFQWKNGMPLSILKTQSLKEKILNKIDIINKLKDEWNEELFENEFTGISAVWRIFLLHIIKPMDYPIFDQHVYRAYKYIVDQTKDGELPYYDKTKLKIYYKDYLPFYLNCKEDMDDRFSSKDLDDALWVFGKFLNEYPKLVL